MPPRGRRADQLAPDPARPAAMSDAVHLALIDGACAAGTVTHAHDQYASLFVMCPGTTYHVQDVSHDERVRESAPIRQPNTWHWPCA